MAEAVTGAGYWFSLPGVGQRFADDRRFLEVPDGKFLTQQQLFFFFGDQAPLMPTYTPHNPTAEERDRPFGFFKKIKL